MKNLSDQELEQRIETFVLREHRNLADLLEHLAELDFRELWSKRRYASLFQYCAEKLGYTASAAAKRATAARLARRYPVIVDMVRAGELSLMPLVMLQRYLSPENHLSLLRQARGKARAGLELMVAALDPQAAPRDRIRVLAAIPDPAGGEGQSMDLPTVNIPTVVRFEFTGNGALLERIERARALLWHKYPNGKLEDVFMDALEALLDKKDPDRRIARKAARTAARTSA